MDERYPVILAAWQAAHDVVDWEGNVVGDVTTAESRFLKRKCCRAGDAEDCRAVFRLAVQVALAVVRFRRSRCGQNPPGLVRRYELLLALASELVSSFPQADQMLLLLASRRLEMIWGR